MTCKEDMKFQNICLCDTVKIAISARAITILFATY